jgi:hypothetical protein
MPTSKSITTKKEKMAETLTLIQQSIEKKINLSEKIQKLTQKCDELSCSGQIKVEHFSPLNS